jgi:hypothetical protein
MQTCFAAIKSQAAHLSNSTAGRRQWSHWQSTTECLAQYPNLDAAVAAARGGEHGTPVLRAFLNLHQRGDNRASVVLLEILRPMLLRVSVYCRTDRYEFDGRREAQAAQSLAALLDVLPDVDDGSQFLGSRIYFRTLSAVTRQRMVSVSDTAVTDIPETVLPAELDGEGIELLRAPSVISWGQQQGVINDDDAAALRHVYHREECVSIREAAVELGIPVRRLESRVRRAVEKLRYALCRNEDAVFSVLCDTTISVAA